MDAVWFAGIDEPALRQQSWFLHIATGGNIRTMDTPIRLTRRMAHLFLRGAYPKGTVERNVRWSQIIGMGAVWHWPMRFCELALGDVMRRINSGVALCSFWSTTRCLIPRGRVLLWTTYTI
jgi:hypothetical protein